MDRPLSIKDFQREKVKERLVKTAARIWGYQPSDMEGFDPIVDLLFGACAIEFEKISQEISNSQSRSLEKLANLMIPEVLSLPSPAHSIIRANPSEPVYVLNSTDQFYLEKETNDINNSKSEGPKKVYFSPVHQGRIFDGKLKYIAKGNELYDNEKVFEKSKIAVGSKGKTLDQQSIWFGLSLNERIESIKGLSFYFDWKIPSQKSGYQSFIKQTQWYIGDQPLKMRHGFDHGITYKQNTSSILVNTDANCIIEDKTLRFYDDAFISIETPIENVIDKVEKYPDEFLSVFDNDQLGFFDTEMLWIRIHFHQLVTHDFIHNGRFSINCFPVVNRRLHSSGRPYSMEKDYNTIGLSTDDFFLAVKSVHNKEGKHYGQLNVNEKYHDNLNTYTVRSGSVGRFDDRNATSILDHVLELMRDESIAFKAWDDRLLAADLREMNQTITRLEHAVYKKSKAQGLSYYLVVKPDEPEDIWVEYWSTTGEFANNIPRNMKLESDSLDFISGDIMTISTSFGGKKSPDSSEKVLAFKSVLLSRDRLITAEDFRAACFAILGNELKNVTINNGIMIGPDEKSGFVRTLEIRLTLSDQLQLNEEENWAYCQQVKTYLQRKTMEYCTLNVLVEN